MPRNSPITLTFPPFSGTVRQLVYANVAVFFAIAVLHIFLPVLTDTLIAHLVLQPASIALAQVWRLVTYPFIETGIFSILFSSLSIWLCGSILEGAYGSRFLRELYFTSAIAGAMLASAISFTRVLGLSPNISAYGAWAGVFGILIAIAVRMGDLEFMLFPLPINIKAKYLVGIYVLIDIATLLKGGDVFGALLHLSAGFAGYLYLRFAPGRGLAFGLTERVYGLRNEYYRAKRRRAARKFEVYMGKQGRKVSFDKEGRYIDPDSTKDPNDKRWMN
ncbi:MAG: rhomboid family intramembrane serine protease [Acidobacteriota bacterium]|nr:rhomboid family intramembrane serine protease [Acidobacteriota bacterium]